MSASLPSPSFSSFLRLRCLHWFGPRDSRAVRTMALCLAASIALPCGAQGASVPAPAATFAGGSQVFPAANVCAPGQTAPAPCSSTLALTYIVPRGPLGAIKVLTLGAPGLDFTLAGSSCGDGAASAVETVRCTVNVRFTPSAPGRRLGAVQIFDPAGNLLTTTNIHGTANGPAIAFSPGTQIVIGKAFTEPAGVAVDGNGNVFVADRGGKVYEALAAGGYTTVATLGGAFPFIQPEGVALDGSGNVFVADSGAAHVYEILANGGYTTVATLASTASFGGPAGLALDGSGNVFVADPWNRAVYEILAADNYATVNPLGHGFGFGAPEGVALDANDNLIIADSGNRNVYRLAAPSYATVVPVGGGFSLPRGVAVDAGGNILAVDGASNAVPEFHPSGTAASLAASLVAPRGIALDATGNAFISDPGNGTVTIVERSRPPALNFAKTKLKSASSDSPRSVQFENIGNRPLTGDAMLSDSRDFTVDPGSGPVPDCNGVLSLSPGAQCNVSFSFTPQSAGPLSSTFTLTGNSLNGNPSTQAIQLTAVGGAQPQITSITPNSGAASAFVTITGGGFGAAQNNGYVVVGTGRAEVTAWSDTSITIRVPSTASTGNLYVYAGSASNGIPFTFEPFPTLTGVSVTSGPVGTPVTFTGTNLSGNAIVTFNGTMAPILSQSATGIQVTVPSGAGSGRLILEVNGVSLLATNGFIIPPFIDNVSPNYGAPSAVITITGSSFGATQGYGLVIVGGARPQITNWSDTSITFRVPSTATSGNVVVETGGQISLGLNFSVIPDPLLASSTPISPATGPPGTTITVNGSYLLDAGGSASATFNGVPAVVTSDSFNSLQFQVPANAVSGQVRIRVNGVTVIVPGTFVVTSAGPAAPAS